MHNNESDWLARAQKGNSEAFTQLVEIYQKPVYNLCYRMLGNAEDAEDASQETFLRAYRSLHAYDSYRPFGTWLLSISAHYCIDQIRKRKMIFVSMEELPYTDLPDMELGPEGRLTKKELQNRIRELLRILEPIDRAAVVLYYWYDFSYEEISDSLSLSLSAVKSRLHRAKREMVKQWIEIQPQLLTLERKQHESPAF